MLLGIGLTFLGSVSVCAQTDQPSDFQQIIDNIIRQDTTGVNIANVDEKTGTYLKQLNPQGAFPDIDYSSKSQTNWMPLTHLNRMKDMALSYIMPRGKYYGNEELYSSIVKMVDYWYDANPKSTNWFYWEIGWPQRMGLNLTLLRAGKKPLPKTTEANMLKRMKDISKGPDQAGSQGTGANKMDIALQWIYRTCLQEDQAGLQFAIDQFFFPLKFNEGQGIQKDYSYLQHGMQLYTAGYGGSVLTAFFKVAFYLDGTAFEQPEKNKLIGNFVRVGYLPGIRGQYVMYNLQGRGISGNNSSFHKGFAGHLKKLKKLDKENTQCYEEAIKRIEGTEAPSYKVAPFHRHYWRADHTIHQRPAYTMDVRTASTRTLRCENGNGENLLGYFMTEGGTEIVRRGNEYFNIFPTWDWSQIPGTTTPHMSKVPVPGQWGQNGQSRFTGGVSDGKYGAMTYQMVNNHYNINTTAKKSWFFFDKEVVCMGADIQSTNTNPIYTTVNQCLLNGKVNVVRKGETAETTQERGQQTYVDPVWVNHDSISYYFPQGGNISLRNDVQSGTWKSIKTTGSAETVNMDVFKLWFDHGTQPKNGAYMYYVVPNTATAQEAEKSLDEMLTVNTDSIQAVYNRSLNIISAVFHEKAVLKVGNIIINSKSPCTALLTDINTDNVKVYVSDPSYSLDSTTLYVKLPAFEKQKVLGVRFNKNVHDLGSTHAFNIDAETPDSVFIGTESVKMQEHNMNMDYKNLFSKLNAEVYPSNATYDSITWTSNDENIVMVDNNGNLRALNEGSAIITATVGGKKDSCRINVTKGLRTIFPSDDAYVYDKERTKNFGKSTSIVVRKDGTNYCRQGFFKFPLDQIADIDTTLMDFEMKCMFYLQYTAENITSTNWCLHPVLRENWTEDKLTWAQKPTTTSLVLDRVPGHPVTNGKVYNPANFIEFSIAEYLAKRFHNETVSISLYQDKQATAGKGYSEFASKDHPNKLMSPAIVFFFKDKPTGIETAESEKQLNLSMDSQHLYLTTPEDAQVRLITPQGTTVRDWESTGSHTNAFFIGDLPKGTYIVMANKQTGKFVK